MVIDPRVEQLALGLSQWKTCSLFRDLVPKLLNQADLLTGRQSTDCLKQRVHAHSESVRPPSRHVHIKTVEPNDRKIWKYRVHNKDLRQ